jgi:hypothetical protein
MWMMMRYITLSQAAQRLGIEEQVLLQWAQQGFLPVYVSKPSSQKTRRTYEKQAFTFLTTPTPTLYFAVDDIEETAEDLAWSRLGRRHCWDEDEDA